MNDQIKPYVQSDATIEAEKKYKGILRILRRSLGLNPYDESKDEIIAGYSKEYALQQAFRYYFNVDLTFAEIRHFISGSGLSLVDMNVLMEKEK
jgi:hypothetical protein